MSKLQMVDPVMVRTSVHDVDDSKSLVFVFTESLRLTIFHLDLKSGTCKQK